MKGPVMERRVLPDALANVGSEENIRWFLGQVHESLEQQWDLIGRFRMLAVAYAALKSVGVGGQVPAKTLDETVGVLEGVRDRLQAFLNAAAEDMEPDDEEEDDEEGINLTDDDLEALMGELGRHDRLTGR